MTIVLSHITAVSSWISGRLDAIAHPEPLACVDLSEMTALADRIACARCECGRKELFSFDDDILGSGRSWKPLANEIETLHLRGLVPQDSDEVHVLVPSIRARNDCSKIANHVCTRQLPAGSIVRLGKSTFCVSPELGFMQVAGTKPLPETVLTAFELCATYARRPDGTTAFGRIPPTSPRALALFAGSARGLPGVGLACRALRYVAGGSASPMETSTTMQLCLPYRFGGYGLPLPRMNARVEAIGRARRNTENGYYLADLYWPDARVIVEYDGFEHHSSPADMAADAMRRNDLEYLGNTVLTLTKRQIYDTVKMDKFARQLAKLLGRRIRVDRGDWHAASSELRRLTLPVRRVLARQVDEDARFAYDRCAFEGYDFC